MYFGDVIM